MNSQTTVALFTYVFMHLHIYVVTYAYMIIYFTKYDEN